MEFSTSTSIGTRFFHNWKAIGCSILFLAWFSSGASTLFAQVTIRDQSESEIISAPRELKSLLEEARKNINKRQWSDAVIALGNILGLDSDESDIAQRVKDVGTDYFLEEGESPKSSLRRSAYALLESMSDEGAKVAEVQYGVTATRQLELALETGNWSAVRDVAERYSFTQAGRKAGWLLAEHRIRSGDVVSAAMILDGLLDSSKARSEFGTDLGTMAVACWKAAGAKSKAIASLKRTLFHWPKGPFRWNGKIISIQAGREWDSSLAMIDLVESPLEIPRLANWLAPSGRADNNGHGFAASVMPIRRWHQWLHPSPQDTELINKIIHDRQSGTSSLIPNRLPILIGKQVIMRTYDQRIVCVDAATGKLLWTSPFDGLPVRVLSEVRMGRMIEGDGLANSVWGDCAMGQLSSDGDRVFGVCENSTQQASENLVLGNNPGITRSAQRAPWNVLRAWSIARQGAVAWEVGDESGLQEPALAGALFLGPPTYHQGSLLVLAEINGEVFLAGLRAESGKMIWRQQLIASVLPIANDAARRNLAATPAAYGNVVVCPTLSGYIVGFDLATRSLLWTQSYQGSDKVSRRGFQGYQENPFDPLASRSMESSVVIANGVACYMAPEVDSDKLIAVDVVSGEATSWSGLKKEWRYVAGVWNENIIVVGDQKIDSLNLVTGKSSWSQTLTLAPGERIVGRSARNANELFVPLSTQEVLKVNLDDGSIASRFRVEDSLGNLVASESALVSVTPTQVLYYVMRDRLRSEVEAQLSKNPTDPKTLALQAEVLFADGDVDTALKKIVEAYRLNPKGYELQSKLVHIGIAALKTNFAKYGSVVAEFEPLFLNGLERPEYLSLMINGFKQSGNYSRAFELLFELSEDRLGSSPTGTTSKDFYEPEKGYTVQVDRWIACQFEKFLTIADKTIRESLAKKMDSNLASVQEEVFPIQIRGMTHFMRLPQARKLSLEMAKEFIRVKDWSSAQRILSRLERDPEFSKDAKAAMIDLYLAVGRRSRAAMLASEVGMDIGTKLPKPIEYPTINQIVDNTLSLANLRKTDKKLADWPKGEVAVSYKRQAIPLSRALMPTEIINHEGKALEDWSIGIGNEQSTVATVVLEDPWGFETMMFDGSFFRINAGLNNDVPIISHVIDDLIIMESATELVAVDSLQAGSGDGVIWRKPFSPPTGVRKESLKTVWGESIRKSAKDFSVLAASTEGIVVRHDDTIECLELETGDRAWLRKGFSRNIKSTRCDNELYIIDRDLARVVVVDMRDGELVKERPLEEAFDFKGAYKQNLLFDRKIGDKQGAMKLIDVRSEKVVLERSFAKGTVATLCENRYWVAIEPTQSDRWTIFYWDLERGLEFQHSMFPNTLSEPPEKRVLNELRAYRYMDTLVLLPTGLGYENEIDDMRRGALIYAKPVMGPMMAIKLADGSPLWKRPAEIYSYSFPINQCRRVPLITLVRVIPKWNSGNKAKVSETASVALLDVRNGETLFHSDLLVNELGAPWFQRVLPAENEVHFAFGGNQFRVQFTDDETPPAPVGVVGKLAPSDLKRMIPKLPNRIPGNFQDSGDDGSPFHQRNR